MRRSTLALLVAPAIAGAQPATVSYQGRLMDPQGAFVSGPVDIQFAVYGSATGGTPIWCEQRKNVGLTDGYYALLLGEGAACDSPTPVSLAQAFAGADRYLEIGVNGAALSPRQRIASVPYAFTAASLADGTGPFQGTGTVNTSSTTNQTAVVGTGTLFGTEILVGDLITINGQSQHVTAVADATHLTVDGNWGSTTAGLTFQVRRALMRLRPYSTAATPPAPALAIDEQGNVGLGTINPQAKLNLVSTSSSELIKVENSNSAGLAYPSISIDNYMGTTSGHPWIGFGNYGGTRGSASATGAGQLLGTLIAWGHDGTRGVQSGRISFQTEGAFSTNVNPTSIILSPGSSGSYKEAMRIRSDGRIGMGTQSPNQKLVVSGACYSNAVAITAEACPQYLLMGNQDSGGVDNPAIIMSANGAFYFGHGSSWSSSTGGTFTPSVSFENSGFVGIGLGNTAGNINYPSHLLHLGKDDAAKPSGGSWLASSDVRLKKNITPMRGALEKLGRLQGVSFEWINPEDHGNAAGKQGGFIAQEVEEVFPSWVTRSEPGPKDKSLVGDDKVANLGLPFEFDALVVESLKELRGENQWLRARNTALEAKNRELEARLKTVEIAVGLRMRE